MTKEELLAKLKAKPKKAQILLRINWDGNVSNKIAMIYTGHDDRYIFGVRPHDRQHTTADWRQAQYITEFSYFKPDIMTKTQLTAAQKYPTSEERCVGIEMEITSKLDHNTLAIAIASEGLENNVCVKQDGSIHATSAYPHGHELAILVTEKEMSRVVKKICKILYGNTSVNKSCGLHVHLDMRTRNPGVAYANLFSAQSLLYAMCPKTRLENTFCKPASSYRNFAQATQTSDRYLGINASAFNKHKTIEIRIHSGTVNASKIINWVKLLMQIADKPDTAVDTARVWRDYKEVKSAIGLRGMLEKYVASRIEEFSEDHENSSIKLTA